MDFGKDAISFPYYALLFLKELLIEDYCKLRLLIGMRLMLVKLAFSYLRAPPLRSA